MYVCIFLFSIFAISIFSVILQNVIPVNFYFIPSVFDYFHNNTPEVSQGKCIPTDRKSLSKLIATYLYLN